MDKFVEIMNPYWISWQQIALENIQFSIVLAIFAMLFGFIIMAILKSVKIAGLKKQLKQQKTLLEQAESKQEEFLAQQKTDSEQIAGFQQQAEQLSADLENEKQLHQSDITKKDDLFITSANEKKLEIDTLNSAIAEKTQHTEQLQNQLKQQSADISQFSALQEKFVEKETQAGQSANELASLHQQLETALKSTNQLIEQLDVKDQLIKSQSDKVSELELQLKERRNTLEMEKIDQQLANHGSNTIQPKQPAQFIEPTIEPVTEAIIESKPEPEAVAAVKEKAPIIEEIIEKPLPKVEPIPEPTIETVRRPRVEEPATEQTDKQGVVNGVLGWFSSIDNALENNKVTGKLFKSDVVVPAEPAEIAPSIDQVEIKPEPVEVAVEKIEQAPLPVKEKPVPVVKTADVHETSFSEKLADVADTMDSLQGKFKGFFSKK